MSQQQIVFDRVERWFDDREKHRALKAVDEYARPYYSLYRQIRESLEGKTDAELKILARAEECVSQTNCGWGAYAVAPLVAQEARIILYARSKAEEGD